MNKDILLISGPSGGGKSTFLRCLASGKLDDAIHRQLPPDAASWEVVEANDILKGDLSTEECRQLLEASGRLCLHYDILFIQGRGLTNHAADPSLTLLGEADRLWVVFISPDHPRVARQHRERRAAQLACKSPFSRWWAYWVRAPLRRLKRSAGLDPRRDIGKFYEDEALLARACDEWLGYLQALCERVLVIELLTLVPQGKFQGHPKFSILEEGDT